MTLTPPSSPAEPAGGASPSHVVEARRHALTTLRLALVFALGAAAASALPARTGAWLPLHLFLTGSLLLAISGASQLFVTTWSSGRAGPEPLVRLQRLTIVVGAAGLGAGRELALPLAATAVAGALVGVGLVALAVLLVIEIRPARTRRFVPVVSFYLVAITAGVVGIVLGIWMLDSHHGVRDAHMAVNLLGLVGLVIAGTLPFFVTTQARVRRSRRATPAYLYSLLVWFAFAITLATAGAAVGNDGLEASGLGAYAVGVLGLTAVLPRLGVKQLRWAGPRLPALGAGALWWIAMVAVAAVRAAGGEVAFGRTVLVPLVVGGYAQILVGSLAYLGPMLRGGGHRRLTAGFGITRTWVAFAALNSAAAVWLAGWTLLTVVAVGVGAVDLGWRALRLGRARVPPPRSSVRG